MSVGSIEYFTEILVRQPLFPYNHLYSDEWERIIFNDPIFEEAIFWSSPSLHSALIKLKSGSLKPEDKDRASASLYKYFLRVSSRCTPFGINAGFHLTHISRNKLIPEMESEGKRIVTPDINFLSILISYISNINEVNSKMTFYKNPMIYTIGDAYRFYENYKKDKVDSFRLATVQAYPIIDKILSASNSGCSWDKLLSILGDEPSLEEKEFFLASLVNEKLIINELEFNILSNDILDLTISLLETFVETEVKQIIDLLKKYRGVINELHNGSLGELPYIKIQHLKDDFSILLGVSNIEQLFQVDLHQSNSNTKLNKNDVNQIKEATDFLSKLIMPEKFGNGELSKFKNALFERYDNEIVPLLEVLDPDCGIGFPVNGSFGSKAESFLLTEIEVNEPIAPSYQKRKVQEDIFGLDALGLKMDMSGGINLSQLDVSGKESNLHKMAPTFSVLCSKLPEGHILLHHVGGTSASKILGRFGIGDEDVDALCNDIVNKEKIIFEGCIVAEVLFCPTGKEGNVVKRTIHPDYYIPINAGINSWDKMAIEPSDLHVTVSDGEIILLSKKLGKRIIPRMSSAHNFVRISLPIYQFLCSIQHQKLKGFHFESILSNDNEIYSPRVSYKKIILSPATWVFPLKAYAELLEKGLDEFNLKEFIRHWKLPRCVAIKEGDNELPIDLTSPKSLQILWSYIKIKQDIKIIEWLHFNEKINESSYSNQFIISFINEKATQANWTSSHWPLAETSQRTFLPGSEILSFKIYCGAHSSDKVLDVLLNKLGKKLKIDGVVETFFFIRYLDPHYHLRIRYFVNHKVHDGFNKVFVQVINKAHLLKEDGLLWKIELGTYNRELKRYGSAMINLVEQIFYIDSICFLKLDSEIRFIDNEQDRLMYAFANVDSWLDLIQLNLIEKMSFTEKMKRDFSAEFENSIDTKSINLLYRNVKADLHSTLGNTFIKQFSKRNKAIQNLMKGNGYGWLNLRKTLPDIIHMSQNRFFISDQRIQEYMVYELIWKYYQSKRFSNRL